MAISKTTVKKVLIIQAEMKHYRIPFFTGLGAALDRDGISLTVAYSNSNPAQVSRNDRADLHPPLGRKVKSWWLLRKFLYQSVWRFVFESDLVIVGPEVKYLVNPMLLVMSALGLKRVAFWGLGPNNHPDRSASAEWFKQHFFTCVDWWFAYTESISSYLKLRGMPGDKITTVQNATDSAELVRQMNDIPDQEVLASKIALTGSSDAAIGLYCGLIGEIKEIPMLLETARLVKSQRPDFHLVIIGNGPDRKWLEAAIVNEPWIHYLGSKFDRESALYYKMADVFLLAGAAGLAVVDSFAAGLPLLVTDLPTHPPEVSYVVDGENGRMAPHTASAFADSIIEVLSDPVLMNTLRQGAKLAGRRYTMEAMIENYRVGVRRCLERYGKLQTSPVAGLPLSER